MLSTSGCSFLALLCEVWSGEYMECNRGFEIKFQGIIYEFKSKNVGFKLKPAGELRASVFLFFFSKYLKTQIL